MHSHSARRHRPQAVHVVAVQVGSSLTISGLCLSRVVWLWCKVAELEAQLTRQHNEISELKQQLQARQKAGCRCSVS